MAKKKNERVRHRGKIQLFVAAASNSYLTGWLSGTIYSGKAKQLCHPGLNCYSCPGALLSCPIGALQAVIGSRSFNLSLYVFGFLLTVGTVLGRMVCGFLCPFGFLQELIYKIPFPPKKNRFKGDRALRKLKYVMLLVLVILLPMLLTTPTGDASPAFCKYVCPAGALEGGIPYAFLRPENTVPTGGTGGETGSAVPSLSGFKVDLIEKQPQVKLGFLFSWKMGILILTLLSCLVIYRPFCKYLCPLGAAYGLLNPVSLYRLRLDEDKCVRCGACKRACKMCLNPTKQLNHAECVRCGDCVNACPTDAITMGFFEKKTLPGLSPRKENV